MEQLVLAYQYKLIKLINKGHHTDIYYGVSIKTGQQFAIKLQKGDSTSLFREASLLLTIQKENLTLTHQGFPICYFFEKGEKHKALIQSYLGKDLHHLLKQRKGIFTIATFLMIAQQMLKRLEALHLKGYIHRAISLKKWAMGLGENEKKLYLIGFGKGKHYRKNDTHIPYSQDRPILNDLNFASINNHLGLQPSRRDDLQSMLYCWAKMFYGKLPWEGESNSEKVLSIKIQHRSQVLFSSFPSPMIKIGKQIKNLSFDQTPNYEAMKNWLFELMEFYKIQRNYRYDWEEQEEFGEYASQQK